MNAISFEEHPDPFQSPNSLHNDLRERPRRSLLLAWLGIAVVLGFVFWPHGRGIQDEAADTAIAIQELQAKYIVGASNLGLGEKIVDRGQIEQMFNQGNLIQRMIGPIVLGEMIDNQSAVHGLEDLESRVDEGVLKASEGQRETLALMRKMYLARSNPSEDDLQLTDDERRSSEVLFPRLLGWAGKLALHPRGTSDLPARMRLIAQAKWMIFIVLLVFGLALVGVIVGVILQIVWWTFAVTGRLSSGIPDLRGDSVVYAEAFAVWLAMYIGLSLLISIPPIPKLGLVIVLIPQIGSLGAMAWPVFRGVRWSDVCADIGLNFGKPKWVAPFIGMATYVSAMPMIGVAMFVTIIMMQIAAAFAGGGDGVASPAHPIVEPILRGNWGVRLQLMFVAVFAAVPEEIMFRGFLYRHLREVASRLGYVASVFIAIVVSSLIFAAIHPQGIMGIPILMAVAVAFALVREWRGSLVPSMVAHALVNAGTSCILFLMAD